MSRANRMDDYIKANLGRDFAVPSIRKWKLLGHDHKDVYLMSDDVEVSVPIHAFRKLFVIVGDDGLLHGDGLVDEAVGG